MNAGRTFWDTSGLLVRDEFVCNKSFYNNGQKLQGGLSEW